MVGPPVRERYNAKARGSVAGGSSHKKRKRAKKNDDDGDAPNDMAEGSSSTVVEDPTAGMSSKKRKRFESFMAKKVKTEQRLETLKLLASLAPSGSTSASLLSSSTLGQNPLNPTSAQERHDKKEDKLVRQGISKLAKKFGENQDDENDSSADDDDNQTHIENKGKGKQKERMIEIIRDPEMNDGNEEDQVKSTVIPSKSDLKAQAKAQAKGKRKGKMPKKANWNPNLLPTQPASSSSSEFDSSDSANDTSEDEADDNQKQQDSQPEAGPSSPTKLGTPKPPPAPVSFGGALKKATDGVAVQPRVEMRKKKPVIDYRYSRGLREEEGDLNEDEDEDSDIETSGEEDEEDDSTSVEDEDPDSEEGSEAEEDDDDDDEEDENEDEDEDEDGDINTEAKAPPKKRALGFKDWALKQMGQATPTTAPNLLEEDTASFAIAKASQPVSKPGELVGPLGEKMNIPTTSLLDQSKGSETATVRPAIKRRDSVTESRMNLPILAEEQSIIESILMNPVVIICGETGSGKTTQVPQMLYEAGFGFKGSDNPGMIAVTQPRRVAAVSLAERVRSELNLPPKSSVVAHQIRYSSTTSSTTSIKFMTDGVLLRELASDFLLSRYSVVVVDEAHERGVNTDVLVGVLSRVAKLREKLWREKKDTDQEIKPLRIVIMSATLRVSDFAENSVLFSKPPPILHITARQHPVTLHFSRRTVSDYVTEAYKKICKIHNRLPQGGILVFMTGQSEIQGLCRKLEKKYHQNKNKSKIQHQEKPEVTLPVEERETEEVELGGDNDLAADVDDGNAESDPEGLDTDEEDIEGIEGLEIDEATDAPMHVLPLYSLLSNEQQMQVFKPPPEGHRLVIISTNVAETSLTIPGIRYVVDSGRAKERHYDPSTGVQSFQVSWISKASSSQRAGRAGRTGPGHCYRLYSSALYEDHFEQFSKPEILRMPIEGVVLQMKSMNIDQVINFPFPTPPDRSALKKAEDLLTNLGALARSTQTRMIAGQTRLGVEGGQITDLGIKMSSYPVTPRFAKMLIIGEQHGCLPYIIAIVAGLSVGDPFVHENAIEIDEGEDRGNPELSHIRDEEVKEKEERKETRKRFFKAQQQFTALGGGASDMFKLLSAVGAYEYDPSSTFCTKNFLRLKAMQEIHQLRNQISAIAKLPLGKLLPPNDTQLKVIRQILTAGFIDQVAVREDLVLKKGGSYESTRGVKYRVNGVPSTENVFIHPSSSLFHRSPPDYLIFTELIRSPGGKTWLKGITKINPNWLSNLGKNLCTFSKPQELPGNRTKIIKNKDGTEEREVYVTPHFRDLGVDLPVMKMRQRKEGTRWVLIE
ncbi:ATP-dependent RNA helicase DHX37/DHR1 [Kwoniella mangroviensis CBS 10435]|uniref:RNA helicase n=1 Tax=Kwoniella mangroviensis CBS 10435 TaxID=1331196 RepID=A0A1B9IIY5_9TREE|nr:ATP-dependent RNA helicase DHX37/DHR1 [Kwoniella mangroviensis CBS 10435]